MNILHLKYFYGYLWLIIYNYFIFMSIYGLLYKLWLFMVNFIEKKVKNEN